ncbi:MAG TPA: DUF5680 domain-containing protein [Candidatus Paceibacterota bacterium]|nr:DUF5680 domain-containing protein [Candidatus Woesebacteria bacterium]HOY11307.1 DUF5680 domain-containing protein [Candidatus Paceibacterota bacterium]HPV33414.1 DUF5680 domain-containing protein [Candidatus Paceibacterota bacterium]HPY13135.1 DUF5680 domain-containing protein [Candidatus Paceibacterota bacterium]
MENVPNKKIEEKLLNIKKFLVEANKSGYAAGETKNWTKEVDCSQTIVYESPDGNWLYHDNFFGGEPYGGREVVSWEGQPVWMMVYYGEVIDKTIDKKTFYNFLQKALMGDNLELPVRGPAQLREEINGQEWVYQMTSTGDMARFKGKETIAVDKREIYNADFSGGLVDVH